MTYAKPSYLRKSHILHALTPYFALMRFNRPIGTFLLLWPTLIAVWLAADGSPDFKTVVIFTLGVIIMRAAGCVINDYADKNFDSHVARTKNRPLAAQQITGRNALILFITLLNIAFILAIQLNRYTFGIACIAVCLAIIYPFSKRFTNYPQAILGLAFACGIPMAYAQTRGNLVTETWVLWCSVIAWVVAYDTQYAMVDKQDDLKIGIKSTAITFNKYDKTIILLLHILALGGFVYIGVCRHFSWVFYAILMVALLLALYQQWLIKDRIPARCFAAFLHNNYFGALLFLGVLLQ